jgi:hypoxia up-regulated 1
LKGFFGGGSNSEDQAPIKADDDSTSTDTPESESVSSSSSDASSPETTAESKKAIQREYTIPLPVNIRFTTILPMTVEEKKKARSRYVQLLINGFTPLNLPAMQTTCFRCRGSVQSTP